MSPDKIEKIKKVTEGVEQGDLQKVTPQRTPLPDEHQFEVFMRQEATKVQATQDAAKAATSKPTLMEEVRNSNEPGTGANRRLSENDLLAQLDATIHRIDTLKDRLSVANPDDLKSSVQTSMRKKLLHIDESLKSALERVGKTEATSEAASADGATTPIERFLSLLTEGQHRLFSLGSTIEKMSEVKELSPANMLAIQLKVGSIQQEIELFTSLLNKALESTKTIMNVQI